MSFINSIRRLVLVSIAALLIQDIYAANNISVTATGGTGGPYPTLEDAFNAINNGTFTGVINISVNGSTTETSAPVLNYSGDGSAGYTSITIRPTVTSTIKGNFAGALIKLYGASHVTIDGSITVGGTTQNLTFINTTSANISTAVIQIDGTSGHGATGDTIRNCKISGNSATTTFAGIISCGDAIGSYSPQATANTGLTIHNNSVSNVQWGISETGPSTSPYNSGVTIAGNQLTTLGKSGILVAWENNIHVDSNTITGIADTTNHQEEGGIVAYETFTGSETTISGNKISALSSTGTTSTIAAIYLEECTWPAGATISGNTIYSVSASSANACGILLDPSDNINGGTINGNNIYNISSASTNNTYYNNAGAAGIFLACISTSSTGLTVSNNFIANVYGYGYATAGDGNLEYNGNGIVIYSGIGYNIYFNSVNLDSNQTDAGQSAAIYIVGQPGEGSAPASLNIENNLFVDAETTGSTYGIYSEVLSSAFTSIDYNDYYATTGLGNLNGADDISITDMQDDFGGNTHSGGIKPNFISATNLHLTDYNNFCLASGTPISGITTDIDGNTRIAPDMGADEFAFYFASTSAPTTCLSSNVLVTVKDTARTLAAGSYKITYSLSAPNASTGDTATLTYVAGTADSGTFIIPESLLASGGSTTVTITSISSTAVCSAAFSAVPVLAADVPSNQATFTVTSNGLAIVPSVIISVPETNVCPGTPLTFTAAPTNGGTTPSYQWMQNGVAVGANAPVYTDSSLVNDDTITCVMTSSSPCASPTSATSNKLIITVTGTDEVPSVVISAPQSTVCEGTSLTFTAVPTHGGTNPSYQWLLNGEDVGGDSTVYTNDSLSNINSVVCIMTSNLHCATPPTVNSDTLVITVQSTVVPALSISAPLTTICDGTLLTFTADAINGGTNPVYVWQKNGNEVGENAAVYADSELMNGDVIICMMTSSASCTSPTTVTSDSLVITVDTVVVPSISISASQTTICSGTPVTFTATPLFGGLDPVYQWDRNGVHVGPDSTTFVDTQLANNDVITCVLVSSFSCATLPIAISDSVVMTVNTALAGTITANSDTICAGSSVQLSDSGSSGNVQWQSSGTNNVFSNILSATGSSYSAQSLSQDTLFRVVASSGNCADTSTALEITVVANPDATFTDSISGLLVSFQASVNTSGLSYLWNFGVGSDSSTMADAVFTYASAGTDTVCLTVSNFANCSSTDCSIIKTTTVGINPVLQLQTQLYPNPAGDNLFVESSVAIKSLTIYDLLGQNIYNQAANQLMAATFKLDISWITPGIYYLKITGATGEESWPFVKR